MSFLLPHLLRDQDAKVDVYFTRVYNPVWTNPDGCSWVEMLESDRIGLHIALTPTWSETAHWADYVLPMGLSSERHDIMSQETHAGTWIGFRQPVGREFDRLEKGVDHSANAESTLGSNPGEVWEEAEFWTALTWRIDPDGKRGIRKYFESKERPGNPVSMDEYFADIFKNVPGLPERAKEEDQTPLEFMRSRGAYDVPYKGQERYAAEDKEGAAAGFGTPSKKLEFYSPTLEEWGYGEHATPGYIRSQVNWRDMDFAAGERALLPTFRLPTLIHTRSANAKWLQEISHTNPLWVHPEDAEKLGIENGGLVRVSTRIGYFIPRAWVTEGIHPGVVACSHHVGRWKLFDSKGNKYAHALVKLERGDGKFLFRNQRPVGPNKSADSDSEKIFWDEAGVNQNLTFPVQPDPISGHALLAPESHRRPGASGRSVRRRLRRHEEVGRGLRRVARQHPPRPGPRQPAPTAVDEPSVAADRRRVPDVANVDVARPQTVGRASSVVNPNDVGCRAGLFRRRSRNRFQGVGRPGRNEAPRRGGVRPSTDNLLVHARASNGGRSSAEPEESPREGRPNRAGLPHGRPHEAA